MNTKSKKYKFQVFEGYKNKEDNYISTYIVSFLPKTGRRLFYEVNSSWRQPNGICSYMGDSFDIKEDSLIRVKDYPDWIIDCYKYLRKN